MISTPGFSNPIGPDGGFDSWGYNPRRFLSAKTRVMFALGAFSRFGDLDAELEQLAMDPTCAPQDEGEPILT